MTLSESLEKTGKTIYEMADGASREWFTRQVREHPNGSFYLYHKKSAGGVWGEIQILCEADDIAGWELSSPERIHPGMSIEQARRFIIETSKRLPLLPSS